MKKTTISHIKFEMLASLLELSRWETVGVLETLWQFCQFHAYDGELTKFEPRMIAAWFGWKSDAKRLIDALVESKWLDRIDDRLVVHDWSDHAPNWVKGALVTTLSTPLANAKRPLSGTLSDTLLGKGKVRKGKVTNTLGFLDWWEVYPRKVARKAAEKAYAKAVTEISGSEGVDASNAERLLLTWTKERAAAILASDERYRPHPATWLNSGRYRDQVTDSNDREPKPPRPFKQARAKP